MMSASLRMNCTARRHSRDETQIWQKVRRLTPDGRTGSWATGHVAAE
jgi:hypothetical protein